MPVIARTQKNSRKTPIVNRKRRIIISVICILCLTPLPRFNVTNARMIWKLYASIDTNKSYWNICWGKHNTVYLWIIRGHVSLPFTSLQVAGKKTAATAALLNLRTATRGSEQFCSVLWRDLNLRRKKKTWHSRDIHWFSVELKRTSWILKDSFETFSSSCLWVGLGWERVCEWRFGPLLYSV